MPVPGTAPMRERSVGVQQPKGSNICRGDDSLPHRRNGPSTWARFRSVCLSCCWSSVWLRGWQHRDCLDELQHRLLVAVAPKHLIADIRQDSLREQLGAPAPHLQ
jgi:hypothetical protein